MLVSWFLIRPALTDTGATARSRMASGIGVTHLLLVVILYLMVFKPGIGVQACSLRRLRSSAWAGQGRPDHSGSLRHERSGTAGVTVCVSE